MKELSSYPLVPRRVRGSWLVAALGACVVGVLGAVFLADTPVGVLSLLLAGLGALLFVTLVGMRLEQERQAEKYGTDGEES